MTAATTAIPMFVDQPEAGVFKVHSDRLPRKLAAILYADVAGYSRLTRGDEDANQRCVTACLDVIADMAARHARHGNTVAANAEVAAVLRLRPTFSIEEFLANLPYREYADREHHRQGLLSAGFPA